MPTQEKDEISKKKQSDYRQRTKEGKFVQLFLDNRTYNKFRTIAGSKGTNMAHLAANIISDFVGSHKIIIKEEE